MTLLSVGVVCGGDVVELLGVVCVVGVELLGVVCGGDVVELLGVVRDIVELREVRTRRKRVSPDDRHLRGSRHVEF